MKKDNLFKGKPFVGRIKEIENLKKFFATVPDSILFIYGPKSSGKSSLLLKVIEELDTKKHAINHISLRNVLIYDFKSFLNVFFPQDFRGKFQDIASGITFNAGFFSIGVADENFLKENPFGVMSAKLKQAREKGIIPIIIIDEIQELKNIYLNGERYLIDELFNFFIEITKTKHLAHVVCATSDSYFIEELYQSSKLAQTSDFFLLDHLDKATTLAWLKDEGVSPNDAEMIWESFGGSPWEIWQVLTHHRNGEGTIPEMCERYLKKIEGKLFDLYRHLRGDTTGRKEEFLRISQQIVEKGFYVFGEDDASILDKLLPEMIERDVWFFVPEDRRITPNSRSVQIGLGRL